jgi:hypothetical protein
MKANDVQEGGDHYKKMGEIEHWDLSIMYKWDPFQYQITKYVMRWKTKHDTPEKRLVDLKKARHFLDKYIENFDVYDSQVADLPSQIPAPTPANVPMNETQGGAADQNWQVEGFIGSGVNLYRCRHCGHLLSVRNLSEAYAFHSDCALAHSYMAQP